MIFGNDYVLTFDGANNIAGKKRLHQSMLAGRYEGKNIVSGIHSHLPETGDFITSTDICTLMLYEKLAGIKHYEVISPNFLSVWNCDTDELQTLTKDEAKAYFEGKSSGRKSKRKRHRD